jgi:hypothetical protein
MANFNFYQFIPNPKYTLKLFIMTSLRFGQQFQQHLEMNDPKVQVLDNNIVWKFVHDTLRN